jgi:hypothetical protein
MEIENFNFCMPEIIINKIMLYLTHPITDIYNNECYYIIQKIKHVKELPFYKIYFYFKKYPILLEYLKSDPNKQIYDVF